MVHQSLVVLLGLLLRKHRFKLRSTLIHRYIVCDTPLPLCNGETDDTGHSCIDNIPNGTEHYS